MRPFNKNLSEHILSVSATMVGVCMMAISIVKLVQAGGTGHLGGSGNLIDKILAFDSVLFLLSSLFSYLSLRSSTLTERLENLADIIFMMGLILMTISSFVLAFELI